MTMADKAPLLDAIQAALDLLEQHGARPGNAALLGNSDPLPSLLDQARALHEAARQQRPAPVRLFHHMACTGGTLMSRCLAAQANTLLLSEIEPLSTLGFSGQPPRFAPTDMILGLRTSARPVAEDTLARVFLAGLGALLEDCRLQGKNLVLRSHPHSRYCHGPAIHDWPGLQQLVAGAFPVRAAISVRHPRASFLSLLSNKWEHYTPSGPEEYARRYLAFLDDHAGLPVFRYEDFVADPDATLSAICAALDLPFTPGAGDLVDVIRLSGDSGRKGTVIAARPERAVPPEIARAMADSAAFTALCERLGY